MNTAGHNIKRADESNERNVISDQGVCKSFDRSLCSEEHKERNGCQNCPHQGDFAVVFVPEMCKKQRSQSNTEQNPAKGIAQHKLSSAPGSAAWAEIGSKPDNAATAPRNVVFLFIIYLFYVRGRQNKNAGTETIK